MKKQLVLEELKREARNFVMDMSDRNLKNLFGVTDGKAVGTYVEHEFHKHLSLQYSYHVGSSASGIDFPELEVDL